MATELGVGYVTLVPSAKGITAGLQKELGAPVERQARASGSKASAAYSNSFTSGAKKIKGLLLGAIGAAGAIEGIKAIADATGKEETANAKLATSLRNSHSAWTIHSAGIEGAVKAGEKFGSTAADTKTALAALTTATNSPAQAVKLLGLAQDLAAKTGKPLEASAIAIAKAQEGQLRPLKQLGIDLPLVTGGAQKLLKAQDKLQTGQGKLFLATSAWHAALANEKALVASGTSTQAQRAAADKKVVAAYTAMQKASLGVKTAQAGVNTVQGAGTKILDLLGQKLKGSAQAQAQTFAGKVRALKAQFEDLQATIGEKLIPIITGLVSHLVGAIHWFQAGSLPAKALKDVLIGLAAAFVGFKTAKFAVDGVKAFTKGVTDAVGAAKKFGSAMQTTGSALSKGVKFVAQYGKQALTAAINIGKQTVAFLAQKAAAVAAAAAQKLLTAAQWLLNAAMDANPITLIVAALAALGLAIFEAYKHFGPFHDAVDKAWQLLQSVFHWVQSHWPLLLAILTGPIGVAVLLIVKHFDGIKTFIGGVITWVRTHWPLLLAILIGPFGLAVLTIVKKWGAITSFFSSLPGKIGGFLGKIGTIIAAPFKAGYDWISTHVFSPLVNWFSGLPGKIGGFIGGIASAISGPFKAAFNAIAGFWNNTVGRLSFKVPSWVPGLGGKGFSVPNIPLAAHGLVASSPTLAMVGENRATTPEVVSPIALMASTFRSVMNEQPHGVIVNVDLSGSIGLDERRVAPAIEAMLHRHGLNNGGLRFTVRPS